MFDSIEPIVENVETIANAAGVRPGQVGERKLELQFLRERGLLFYVSVSGTSLFSRRASFGEYGIADEDVRRERYTPGAKFIFPRKYANKWRSIENRARDLPHQFAFGIEGFAPAVWMPWMAIKDFRRKWVKLEKEVEDIKREIKAQYTFFVANLEEEFTSSAHLAWVSLQAQGWIGGTVNGRPYYAEEDFTAALVESAMGHIPTLDEVMKKLQITYTVARVMGAEDVARDELKAAELRAEAKKFDEFAKAEKRILDLRVQNAEERVQHEQLLRQAEQNAANARAEAEMAVELERARKNAAETTSFIDEIYQGLRDRMANAAQEILDSIQKNKGVIKGKVAEKAAGLTELYGLLATHDDYALHGKLQVLRNQIGQIGERDKNTPARDAAAVRTTLEEIIRLAENELADVTRDNRARFLEID